MRAWSICSNGWSHCGYDPEQVHEDVTYARYACLREWLRERGYEPHAVLPDSYSGQRTTSESNYLAREIALREWMIYHGGEDAGQRRATE